MTHKKTSRIDLANDKILKLFFNYFLPMLFAMLAVASYSTIDGIFVNKKLGDNAMKAITAVWPLFPILTACALMFALGGASMIGYYLAKNKKKLACAIFSSMIYFLFPFFFVVGILCYLYAHIVITWFIDGLSAHVELMAIEYLKGICIGLFVMILHPILDLCVINDKRPKLAMFAMLLGAVCNIIFNYLFLFVWEFGIIGSSYATILGHFVGSLVLLWHYIPTKYRKIFLLYNVVIIKKFSFLVDKQGDLQFIPVFSPKFLKRAVIIGFPFATSEMSVGFVMWLYNRILKDISGEDALAIYSVILYAGFIFFTFLLALAQSIQPLASFNYGMRKFERLKQILFFYVRIEIILSLLLYCVFYVFDEYVAAMFLKNQALKAQSIEAMKIYFLGYIFLGTNMIIALYLQSLQRALASFFTTLSYTLVFLVIFLPLFAYRYGLNGAFMAYPIAQIVALCVSIIIMKYEIKHGLYTKK